jgi:hypothetical protein
MYLYVLLEDMRRTVQAEDGNQILNVNEADYTKTKSYVLAGVQLGVTLYQFFRR